MTAVDSGYLGLAVQKIPRYTGGNHYHEEVLKFFQLNRDPLYRAISRFTGLRNPFVSIDQALGVAERLDPERAEGHIKFVYGRMLSDLRNYARRVQEMGRSGTVPAILQYGLIARVELDALEQKRRANHQRRSDILSEVEDLQRLALLYYNARMARRRIELAKTDSPAITV